MMLQELATQLKTLGYPVAYSHFKTSQTPPFMVYLVTDVDTFAADNQVLHELTSVDIELYVTNKSTEIETQIKNLLNANELPWQYDESYIQSEGVFKCTFSITLI